MQGSKNLLTTFFFFFFFNFFLVSLSMQYIFPWSLKVATYFHMLVVNLVILSFYILYYPKISKNCAYKYHIYFFMLLI
jgi:hypothetical protein